ncbi:pur operon repressor [Alkalibaculum sp. M08DMB]|uniref:Pur operon repressor n=1 Tax=Alkalibaculum sporogenes TaxID=2655001 RepID=A0A6A7K6A6_9FIRM|nr:pur operon repressor [Alkalibaculum sporogenes]MPW24978.1 pur operon repressor [Alkalibaculum sporogenes]
MEKYKRNERIGAIIKVLGDNPSKVITYNYFSELFSAAKSSISEDILVVKKTIETLKMGRIETIAGAAGGVRYIPIMDDMERKDFINSLCNKLRDKNRIISGGYIYYTDIIYSPELVDKIGKIIAGKYIFKEIDYVVTMETKGIPIALMTARYLNRPLIIVRRDSKVTDGAIVSINYMSGTSSKISTMSLSKRSISNGSKVIIVDDFMKGGGTALGIIDLLKEFDTKVEGITVLIASKTPEDKLVKDYDPLMVLQHLDAQKEIVDIVPYEHKDYV